ncbi:putative ribonuclease H-like domain-containing protein [Tanacetum coccineum]
MSETQDEIPPPPPPQQTTKHQHNKTPHTVSTIKAAFSSIWEYVYGLKMAQYLAHTDYLIWGVIQRLGMVPVKPSNPGFGGNDESKRCELEIHGAGVSTEDANQKFLRSLPSAWLQIILIETLKSKGIVIVDVLRQHDRGTRLSLLDFQVFNGGLLLWRFSWAFFLRTKDETSAILKDFIRQIENQLNQKVKTIRCDNGTEFKNRDIIEFCGLKGIKREYSNARTTQTKWVAEKRTGTIGGSKTLLADSFLPNTFWAESRAAKSSGTISLSDNKHSQEDDSKIPPLEDIHEDTTDGIFTHSSYDDEGVEADFTNLETVVNVFAYSTFKINPSHLFNTYSRRSKLSSTKQEA